jgi:ABC-type Zn uptake system ZnuABC Zn-binding protein ZnuA
VARLVGSAAVLCSLLASCSGISAQASKAPVLTVVTGLYPLAAAAKEIGQSKVEVVDVVPEGTDPTTYQPTTADIAQMRAASLILEAGGGVQPPLEKAAASASGHVLSLGGALPGGPYPWVDPPAMDLYIQKIEAAMAAADPQAASLFSAAAQAFKAQVDAIGGDYESTLSLCAHTTVFTADRAFTSLAASYGLKNVTVGEADPSSMSLGSAASEVRSSGVSAVFAEPWIADNATQAVAQASGVKLRTLDTLLGAPPAGWPAQASTYPDLLEINLDTIDKALACGGSLANQ